MKVYKSILAASLAAAVTILPLSGCSLKRLLWNEEYNYEYVPPEPTEPVDSIISNDAEDIYAEIEYTPEMFYGTYVVDGVYESDPKTLVDPDAFRKGKSTLWSPNNDGAHLTALPYRIEAGPHTNQTELNDIDINDSAWMTMYVVSKDGEQRPVEASYSIKGHNLMIRQISEKTVDPDTGKVNYRLTQDPIVLNFQFHGTDLTLSHGLGETVELHAEGVSKDSTTNTMAGISVTDSNLVPGSNDIQGITSFSLKNDSGAILENEAAYPATVKFGEDGFCELEWNNKKSKLIYFYGGADGLVFSDGKKNYLYTARSYDLYAPSISGNLANPEDLSGFSQEEINELVSRSEQLLADLNQAFADAGVNAQIDDEKGEITLNSVSLFDFAHSELTAEGREYVNRFLAAYTSVICSDKYDGFISEIKIQGHTDTKGSYGYNKTLSENRAASVLNYCISPESGLSPEIIEKLTPLLTSEGLSYDNPIYNEDGSVNDNASRRVVFHYNINTDKNAQ